MVARRLSEILKEKQKFEKSSIKNSQSNAKNSNEKEKINFDSTQICADCADNLTQNAKNRVFRNNLRDNKLNSERKIDDKITISKKSLFGENNSKSADSLSHESEKIRANRADSEETKNNFSVIETSDGRKIRIEIEKNNNIVRTILQNGKMIIERATNVIIEYKGKIYECMYHECEEILREVSEATDRHVSISKLKAEIEKLVGKNKEEIDLIEKYGEKVKEIEKDPLTYFLKNAEKIIAGNEEAKLAVLLSLVSSRFGNIKGVLNRVNVLLVGASGSGKSDTVRSILEQFPLKANEFVEVDNITPKALYYENVDTFDNKVYFVHELDDLNYLSSLKKLLTEGGLKTKVTITEPGKRPRTEYVEISGTPSFISTTVIPRYIDEEVEQLLTRLLVIYIKPDLYKSRVKIEEKELNPISELVDEETKLINYAYLMSRKEPRVTPEIITYIRLKFESVMKIALPAFNRVYEITYTLTKAYASLHGRDIVAKEDVDMIFYYFGKTLMLNTVMLSERDIKMLKAVREIPYVNEIAKKVNETSIVVRKTLERLEERGLIVSTTDDKDKRKKFYELTDYGKTILTLMEEEKNNEVIETDTGMAEPEFFRNDRTRNSENAVREHDTGTMQRGNGEVDPTVERGKKEDGAYMKEYDVSQANDDKRDDVNLGVNVKETNLDICAKFDGREISDEEYANEKPVELWNCLHNAKAYIENSKNGRRIYKYVTN